MRSKTDFYRLPLEQLARKGPDVKRSQSSDYIAGIYYKNQFVTYSSKADTVIQNSFITVKERVMWLINDAAWSTTVRASTCRDCPYTDADEKLSNGPYKLVEHNGVTLACKEYHLFGYAFFTYRTALDSGGTLARQVFYNKELADQDFTKCSGLVDERAPFSKEELRVLYVGLVRMSILDHDASSGARGPVERILNKVEETMPELWGADMDFDFDVEFRLSGKMGMGGQSIISSERDQTIIIVRSLTYKHNLSQQPEGVTDEEYLADPIGLGVGSYVKSLMRHCPEDVTDQVMEYQDTLPRRLEKDYLSVTVPMPYEEGGGVRYA